MPFLVYTADLGEP